jgi:lipoprotein-releasing system permease protein
MALIIIVAVVNVVTSLVMLVFERQREIGILKCSGVSSESIILIFLFAGIIAAVSGIILGLSGGLLVSRYINEIIHGIESVIDFIIAPSGRSIKLLNENYYLQHIPSDLRWKETLYIGLATLFTSAAASLYPAVKAAGLKPLEVLRKH